MINGEREILGNKSDETYTSIKLVPFCRECHGDGISIEGIRKRQPSDPENYCKHYKIMNYFAKMALQSVCWQEARQGEPD